MAVVAILTSLTSQVDWGFSTDQAMVKERSITICVFTTRQTTASEKEVTVTLLQWLKKTIPFQPVRTISTRNSFGKWAWSRITSTWWTTVFLVPRKFKLREREPSRTQTTRCKTNSKELSIARKSSAQLQRMRVLSTRTSLRTPILNKSRTRLTSDHFEPELKTQRRKTKS